MIQFNELGLAETLLRAIQAEGYDKPTPIQSKVIPAMMEGRDVLGTAQTGTGKTAAFVLPILNRVADRIANS
ncbi:MAG: ATP-dependent RNA helicase RhlE, partial [Alphaproteobacteria bacterium]